MADKQITSSPHYCPASKGMHHFTVSYPPTGNFGPVVTICRYCGKEPTK